MTEERLRNIRLQIYVASTPLERELFDIVEELRNHLKLILRQCHHWPDCSFFDITNASGQDCNCWLQKHLEALGYENLPPEDWDTCNDLQEIIDASSQSQNESK